MDKFKMQKLDDGILEKVIGGITVSGDDILRMYRETYEPADYQQSAKTDVKLNPSEMR